MSFLRFTRAIPVTSAGRLSMRHQVVQRLRKRDAVAVGILE